MAQLSLRVTELPEGAWQRLEDELPIGGRTGQLLVGTTKGPRGIIGSGVAANTSIGTGTESFGAVARQVSFHHLGDRGYGHAGLVVDWLLITKRSPCFLRSMKVPDQVTGTSTHVNDTTAGKWHTLLHQVLISRDPIMTLPAADAFLRVLLP